MATATMTIVVNGSPVTLTWQSGFGVLTDVKMTDEIEEILMKLNGNVIMVTDWRNYNETVEKAMEAAGGIPVSVTPPQIAVDLKDPSVDPVWFEQAVRDNLMGRYRILDG